MDQVQFSKTEAEEIEHKSPPSPQLNDITEEPGRLGIGVTFSNLEVQAHTTADQRHYDLLDWALAIPMYLVNPLRSHVKCKIPILRECEGIIQPGEMLLVLGRAGSGCSTFLKSLAGNIDGLRISNESQIKYQGISHHKFHKQFKSERVYVGEPDVHFPELTVGETLDFAVSTRSKSTNVETGREIASELGLESALKISVGSASESEKRRTSIAEACISGAQLQCWDNSTRGLDSSTALRFIKFLRRSVDAKRSTVAMSLYQASDEIYQQFDKVIVLYEGRQIYFGPTRGAVDYFRELGFVKPNGVTTADFLTSLTHPAERQIYGGNKDRVSVPDEFAGVWKQSEQARKIRNDIADFNSTSAAGLEQLSLRTSTHPVSILSQVFICLKRASLRTRHTFVTSLAAAFIGAILGLLIGSVYYNMDQTTDSLQSRCLLLFLAVILNGFASASEVLAIWAHRPVVEKHRRYAFYQPFAENLAEIICGIPIKIISCFAFNIPLYFMANLRRSASAFFLYWFFMLTLVITMSILFRAIGSVSRTLSQTDIPVAFVTVCCIIYTGFALPYDYVLSWWGWFRRANPLTWTYENVLVNEMHDRPFLCSLAVPVGPGYETIEPSQQICATIGSQPGQPYVQGTAYISIKYGYLQAHVWRNFGILVAMAAGYCIIHLLAAQFIPAQRPRGEVLVFKRSRFSKSKTTADEENTMHNGPYHPKDLTSIPTDTTRQTTNVTRAKIPASQQGALLHWSDVKYEAKGRTIIHHANGWLQPGRLTALMGATGAGKTSLLNILAGRVTVGEVTGSISIDGRPRTTSYQRKVGCVQQDDVHLATTTVREALEFSALLRQPKSKTKREKLAYVEEVLELMDMQWYADAVVGAPGEGLNPEQRKRLSIAVELAAQPELLLLVDEPTSGLDSQAAWSICALLRKLADSGHTILCAIHEPSFQLLTMFDRLLLLGNGGSTLYFGDIGDDASTVVTYLESNGTPACQPGENPAEWILNVTSSNVDSESRNEADWAQKWDASPQKQEVLNQLNILKTTPSEIPQHVGRFEGAHATSFLQQTSLVTKRTFLDQWRSPAYLFAKLVISVGTALLNGFSFFNTPLDMQSITGLLSSMFFVTYLASHIFQTVVPYMHRGIGLFTARERGSRMYSWVSFLCANVFVEVCWQTLLGALVYASWYYPTGLQRNGDANIGTTERGGLTFVCIWLFLLWASTLSQALAAGIQNAELVTVVGTFLYWISLVNCGFLMPPAHLMKFWVFMYRVSPLTYIMEGLAVGGLAHGYLQCSDIELLHIPLPQSNGTTTTCGTHLQYLLQTVGGYVVDDSSTTDCQYCLVKSVNILLAGVGMNPTHTWRNVGLLWCYVVFNILAIFGLFWATKVFRRRY